MKLNRHYILCALFGAIYAGLTILIPADANVLEKYKISAAQAHVLGLTVVVPYVLIWFAAFYGFIQCRAYAAVIKDSKDGQALDTIGNGLMYLAVGLPFLAISSTLLNYASQLHPDWLPATTITMNYLSLIVILLGFYTISQGTSQLIKTVKSPPTSLTKQLAMLAFGIFCIAYVYITLTNPARQFPTTSVDRAAYYLPDFLLLITIIIPYLLVWYWGFRSVYQIHIYRKHVNGIVYKESLGLFAQGIAAVVISLMVLRVLVSLTTLLNNLTLKLVLLLLYVLLVIISIGYILIALGAKKMKKIEEV